jgi:hypothetical protein
MAAGGPPGTAELFRPAVVATLTETTLEGKILCAGMLPEGQRALRAVAFLLRSAMLVLRGESPCPVCHAEPYVPQGKLREASPRQSEILRFAQGDNEVKTFAHVC